jgi:hypothetical protein
VMRSIGHTPAKKAYCTGMDCEAGRISTRTSNFLQSVYSAL